MPEVDSGRSHEGVGAGDVGELSVLSVQLCYEPKTTLKIAYFKGL
jgi:hypothetical protein